MNDLISRQAILENVTARYPDSDATQYNIGYGDAINDVLKDIRYMPSVQKTGEWIWVQYDSNPEIGNWHCSVCRFMPASFNLAKKHLNYCPNCGASMRSEEE